MSMKIISCNLNGIRASARKGFFSWAADQEADFVCVQETKAQMATLDQVDFALPGMAMAFAASITRSMSREKTSRSRTATMPCEFKLRI